MKCIPNRNTNLVTADVCVRPVAKGGGPPPPLGYAKPECHPARRGGIVQWPCPLIDRLGGFFWKIELYGLFCGLQICQKCVGGRGSPYLLLKSGWKGGKGLCPQTKLSSRVMHIDALAVAVINDHKTRDVARHWFRGLRPPKLMLAPPQKTVCQFWYFWLCTATSPDPTPVGVRYICSPDPTP